MGREKTTTRPVGRRKPKAVPAEAAPAAVSAVVPLQAAADERGPGRSQRWLPTLAEMLAGELREQILDGDIPDGGKLPKQQDLLDHYQVSAPSLREALRILENEGLVTVKRGKVGGAVIHRPTVTHVANMVALVLEANSATVADVAALLEDIEPLCVPLSMSQSDFPTAIEPRLREAIDDHGTDDGASADRFHQLLVESCGNQTMLLQYQALMAVWQSHVADDDGAVRGDDFGKRAEAAHTRILTLMTRGDAAAARQFAARHLVETGRFRAAGDQQAVPISVDRFRSFYGPATGGDWGRSTSAKGSSRVAEVIAADLRRRILLGELVDGGLLDKQRELADSFNVSFPAVREALRILESEGLLMVRRGSIGGSVARLPRAGNVAYVLAVALQSRQASMQDLVVAMQQLEPLCAAACARRSDRLTEVIPLLDPIIESERDVIDDPEAFAVESLRFHDVLISHCGNPAEAMIVGAMQSLWSAQMQSLKRISQGLGVIDDPAKRQEVVAEHRDMYALIAAGDADAAEELARSHIGHADRQASFTGHGLRVHASLLRD